MKKLEWISRPIQWLIASLLFGLVALFAGCGGSGASGVSAPAPGSSLGVTAPSPTVVAVVPLADATGVPVNLKKITAAFSNTMESVTLTSASFTLSCPTAPVAGGVVSYLATGKVATLSLPVANLPASTQCTVTVTTGVRDASGVALASNYVWKFTTGIAADTTPPSVALTVPVDGVTGVATNTMVSASFSENMDPASITATNFTVANTTAGGGAVVGAVTYLLGSKVATFTPAATLPASSLYTATISTTVADLAGNLMAANKVWTFTTGAAAVTSVFPGVAGTPGASTTDPTVNSANPSNGAINVATSTNQWTGSANVVTGKLLTANFSQTMNPATITTPGVFTLKETVAGTNVPGSVVINATNTAATFTPTVAALMPNTFYTVTVSTAALNAGGTAMANAVVWGFKTNGVAMTEQAPVELGSAGNYTIFALTGIANATTPAVIAGDMGVGPGVTSTAITGPWALTLPAASAFSTSAQVSGKVYAFDYANPTPAYVTTTAADMSAAYNDAFGRTAAVGAAFLNVGGGSLSGLTLPPGTYTWGSAVTLPFGTNLTLAGGPDDVWIFQISGTLTTAANTNVFLSGGARAKNVFWQTSGAVTLGATAHIEGVVLSKTAINFGNQATANSRLLAQTAVNLDQNAVAQPVP